MTDTREMITRILAAAGNPNYAAYVHKDADGTLHRESVGKKDMSSYAENLTDEQYHCIAQNIVRAMQAGA